MICYCSNFDLNFNEWYSMYENMLLFNRNLLLNLGKYQSILAYFFHNPVIRHTSYSTTKLRTNLVLGDRWHIWFSEVVIIVDKPFL